MKNQKSSGPEAERVKIEGDWQKAVGKALKAKKPEPKSEKKKGAK